MMCKYFEWKSRMRYVRPTLRTRAILLWCLSGVLAGTIAVPALTEVHFTEPAASTVIAAIAVIVGLFGAVTWKRSGGSVK